MLARNPVWRPNARIRDRYAGTAPTVVADFSGPRPLRTILAIIVNNPFARGLYVGGLKRSSKSRLRPSTQNREVRR